MTSTTVTSLLPPATSSAAQVSPMPSSVQGFGVLVAQLAQVAGSLGEHAESGAWNALPIVVAPSLVEELMRVRDLIGAVVTAGVSVVHASAGLPGGHVSTTRWLQQAAGLSGPSASAQLARMRSLRDFPLTRIAALSGELSEDKVRAITQGMETALAVLDPAARTAAIDGVEAELVEFARAASVERIRRKITLLRFALDPHGADARAMAAFDDQHLRFTPLADGVQVSGWLTQETAAAVLTCLDQTVDAWFRSGTDGAGRAMTRAATRAHLVALALGELAGRMLTSASSGTKQRQRPHLTLTLDLADYRAGLGGRLRLPGHGEALLARASTDRIRCDSDLTAVVTRPMGPRGEPSSRWTSGAALDPSDYRRLADWLRTQSREVLFVGRAERTAPPRLRRALDLRDGGCVAPGCDVDPSRCEAHHVQHWTHGGGTDLDNMALVYRRHHHLVHEGGWTLTADRHRHPGSTGYWQLTPPGRERPP